ncbi:MAG: proton-conducting transporter membrane subunit [Thermoanaerobacteraceae bacterium]|nr:proton-conducting transporter membrane subunit [Thermoanaerobacteraceae bacterium]
MATFSPAILILCMLWAFLFDLVALFQKNIRKMLVFSAIAGFGFIAAGYFLKDAGRFLGTQELVNYIIMRSLMFLTIGSMAGSSKYIDDLKGRGTVLKGQGILYTLAVLAVLGVSPIKSLTVRPDIFYSMIKDGGLVAAVIGFLAVIMEFCYLLRSVQKIMFAPYEDKNIKLKNNFLSYLVGLMAVAACVFNADVQSYIANIIGTKAESISGTWPMVIVILAVSAFVVYAATKLNKIFGGILAVAATAYAAFYATTAYLSNTSSIIHLIGTLMLWLIVLVVVYMIDSIEKDKIAGLFFFTIYLSASIVGLITAASSMEFYEFWELLTISSYFMAVIVSTKEARKAALTYLLAAVSAGYAMFIGFAILSSNAGSFEFDKIREFTGTIPISIGIAAVLAIIVGLGLKAELFPLYGWVPGLYKSADSSVSALFAGVMSKAGVIGLIIVLYVLLKGFAGANDIYMIVAWLGALTMLFGTMRALMEDDAKRLLAYCSISQMGYVITGLAIGSSLGFAAGMYHAVNHMMFKTLLFLCIGAVVIRTGTSDMNKLGGLAKKMPVTTGAVVIGAFSAAGIPLFSGFASKWMIYQALISEHNINYVVIGVISMIASTGTILYMLKFIHSIFFGRLPENLQDVKEIGWLMQCTMLILSLVNIVLGVVPGVILKPISDGMAEVGLKGISESIFSITGVLETYKTNWLIFVLVVLGAVALFFIAITPKRGIPRKTVPVFAGGDEAKYNNITNSEMQISGVNIFDSIVYIMKEFFNAWSFIKRIFSPIGKLLNSGEN